MAETKLPDTLSFNRTVEEEPFVTDAVDDLLGKTLNGRFEILSPLGVGGMGRVYKAIQHPLDRVIALKVLNPRYDGSKDPGFEKRFFFEASMTAKLHHPNTITIHDYGRTDDGIYFIAMEYLEGETLQQVLAREKNFAWPRTLVLGAQVARSLREAHKLNLVHRDLKPANIMMVSESSGGDTVKVLDFGLVKSFLPEHEKTVEDTALTQAGMLLGSPMYMAPEQTKSESDGRSDIYSLGVVMFQCIAGRPPFVSKDSIDIIIKHVKEMPPELKSLATQIPDDVNQLIMRCLQKNPIDRFQSMDELLENMRHCLAGQGLSGVFADPRVSSVNVPVADPALIIAPARTATDPSTEITDSGSYRNKAPKKNRLPFAIGLVSLVALLAGGAIAVASKDRSVAPSNVVPLHPPIAKPPPEPEFVEMPIDVPIVFVINSIPLGASVSLNNHLLGVTPLEHKESRTNNEPVTREFSFALEGFATANAVAQGLQGEIPVSLTLVPLPKATKFVPKKQTKNNDAREPGYKEDPY
jgi:eukaryotic-like serine/threonine-protein kinase